MVKNLIEYIVKSIVSDPNKVKVVFHNLENKKHVEIFVDTADRGRVIGKEGRAIKALRNLIEELAPTDQKVTIDLNQ